MRNHKSTKTKLARSTDQLLLPFELPIAELPSSIGSIAPTEVVPSIVTKSEILPPILDIFQEHTPKRSASEQESEALRQRSEKALKYEDRAMENVRSFLRVAVLAILTKAGIPVTKMLLKEYQLPPLDGTLISGALGIAALVYFTAALYYALWVREHSYHLEFKFSNLSLAGKIAQMMLTVSAFFLVAMFIVVFSLTAHDILKMATYLYDHYFYVVDGWEPLTKVGR